MLVTSSMIISKLERCAMEEMQKQGKTLTGVIDLNETPEKGLKHACTAVGQVGVLPMELITVPVMTNDNYYSTMTVNYFLCRQCGRFYLEKKQVREQMGGI